LLAYNPMIPLDAERSGLPVAIFAGAWSTRAPNRSTAPSSIASSTPSATTARSSCAGVAIRSSAATSTPGAMRATSAASS
jgi:hypothetical protein